MKPWKDDQSLFCDTSFLEDLIKKPVAKGKECSDARN